VMLLISMVDYTHCIVLQVLLKAAHLKLD
jgi:hypothetical protein